ncbi:MAG: hypothetical protein F6K25_09825 [Okeania sp. SIO2G4]|uniref:hypothetical protein n=1 Tax=unclassified Okeania TaxID=2634635 RepID=UPI0013B7CDAA|nr:MULTISPECIES: hypothetical protein [unclassified Okeania]NEP03880.1 hypothetical protein [Okeania sp. SIO4D6]NEP40375.1 hypothetical protein [Okeania sp. SIO2H7]NEP72312.1 hypothetical protein [Okeania sp. SIO2G5]NEP94279.1 hypothetical protein [Okeania sp. SIO2F5]NEQ90992.1 hypothetical protein [Okeania sp. SIO2G4]
MVEKSNIVKALKKPNLALKKGKRFVAHNLEDVIRIITQQHKLSEIVNQKEIRVAGMKRSGNHAIINWVKSQQNGDVGFINNVLANQNPYRYKYENLRDKFPEHKWAIEHNRQQAKGNFIKRDCLIYSYEYFPLEQIANDKFERNHDIYLGKSATRYDILIIRDPFNLLASRLKISSKVAYFLSVNSPNKTMIDLWLDYAKEYLGETNYLKHNKVCVNYNQWFADVEYRRNIADKLQMEFSDAGIDMVTSFGGGSSFEGKEFDGKATSMDVLNRWRKVVDNPQYKKFFNREIFEYSERIFGHIPGTESLMN